MKSYHEFNEVEEEIREATAAHPIVYKYRDWRQEYNRRIITDREAWFAHPHTLNDPYDVRPPYNFIVGNINWSEFGKKLYNSGRQIEPTMPEDQFLKEVDNRLKEAQADPVAYFHKTRGEYINDKSHYEQIGIFSCCTSGVNEPMWAHYGDNHCGFAIGFDTVEFARTLNCSAGYVDYDDTSIEYRVLENNDQVIEKEIFQKGKNWIQEEEFRFATAGIGKNRDRASIFPLESVKEILFGKDISKKVKDEIMQEASKSLPGVPFYQVTVKPDSYGFQKVKI